MMSLKSVNALTHYTDYIIAHVHVGALAWNGGLAFAMLYYIVPRIHQTKLYSVKLANTHFWLATTGVLFYAVPLYIGGITQSLMWREFTAEGALRYPNFLETVLRIVPMYALRAVGGVLFLLGACVAAYNLYRTARAGRLVADEATQAAPLAPATAGSSGLHRTLEGKPFLLSVLILIAVGIGGVVEYVPTALIRWNIPTIATVRPYTPLEIEGRDLYIREGCNTCHSQMIRPLRSETERYGDYSKPGEFVYDHPFLWGSKRTGPDLHRIGGKYPDSWHFMHMRDPKSTSPGSIMPGYPWLYTQTLAVSHTEGKIITLRRLGVPYPIGYEYRAADDLRGQARRISDGLKASNLEIAPDREIVALIAYLQRLGTDLTAVPTTPLFGTPAGTGGR